MECELCIYASEVSTKFCFPLRSRPFLTFIFIHHSGTSLQSVTLTGWRNAYFWLSFVHDHVPCVEKTSRPNRHPSIHHAIGSCNSSQKNDACISRFHTRAHHAANINYLMLYPIISKLSPRARVSRAYAAATGILLCGVRA